MLNKDVGFVRVGQDIAVKLEAFSFTRFGTVLGKVRSMPHKHPLKLQIWRDDHSQATSRLTRSRYRAIGYEPQEIITLGRTLD